MLIHREKIAVHVADHAHVVINTIKKYNIKMPELINNSGILFDLNILNLEILNIIG